MITVRHSRLYSAVISSVFVGTALLLPTLSLAQTAAPAASAAVDTVSQPYIGVINDDNVYVRSGPSEVFYATTKLNKGIKVTVVAVRKDWVKIIPPDGSFSYVARAYVEKRGDGTVGRVTKPDLNVRAGSNLNGMKITVQTSLAEGDQVKILPDQVQDEYFKIAPPPGAFLYVKKAFVDTAPDSAPVPISVVAADQQKEPIASAPVPPPGTVMTPSVPAPVPAPAPAAIAASVPTPVVATPSPVTPVSVAPVALISPAPNTVPTTNPAMTTAIVAAPATQPTVAMAAVPATQPIQLSDDAKFDDLESQFLDVTNQPLAQQPVSNLLAGYTALSTDSALPSSMKRIVDVRITTLKYRADAQKQLADAMKLEADAKAKQVALKAESDELIQKVKDQSVSIYTALGTLRISSLQQAGTTLYRLTDPGTGHTLLYIKSNDAKYAGLIDQFIGVKGDVSEDAGMNLKFIAPTEVATVDPAKVNTTVTATVIPPSLLPRTAAAN